MKLFRMVSGIVLEHDGSFIRIAEPWDALINRSGLIEYLTVLLRTKEHMGAPTEETMAPIDGQEVWAAGVTYFRSRSARMDESSAAGGGGFYDRVYAANRPELFFKSAGWRVRGPGQSVRVRRDARWTVPEPELAVCVNKRREIVGYTIGNDMSSRDIEGANPLYLPQAKIYDGSCALGPALLVTDRALPADTTIGVTIARDGYTLFEGSTTLAQLRRTPMELIEFLYRETSFPAGCVLLTGTGVVPPDEISLRSGDTVRMEIPPIGVLVNPVE